MKELFGLYFYDDKLDNLREILYEYLTRPNTSEACFTIYTPNVQHIISIKDDNEVYLAYKSADLLVADGWPLEFVSKLAKRRVYQITGIDLMEGLLNISNELSLNIFLLGSCENTLDKLKQNINKKFNNICICGSNNGYFPEEYDERVIERINTSKTDVLFVGMGHPKQELWISKYRNMFRPCIIVGVGGAFKVFSGEIKRAPGILIRLKLEWFWRFLNEPLRLFYRYFIRYPRFIGIAIKEIFNIHPGSVRQG